jgi:hypothetical protein
MLDFFEEVAVNLGSISSLKNSSLVPETRRRIHEMSLTIHD